MNHARGTGGLLFVLLDQFINQKGGYLRKTAYIISKSAVDKEKFFKKAMKDVADVPLFYKLLFYTFPALIDLGQP